jgi:hypothetical protein
VSGRERFGEEPSDGEVELVVVGWEVGGWLWLWLGVPVVDVVVLLLLVPIPTPMGDWAWRLGDLGALVGRGVKVFMIWATWGAGGVERG